MKLTASILLFYFSFLALQPVLPLIKQASAQDEQCTMYCCHKEKKNSKKQIPAGNCCNKDMCNPFAQYSCCIGFVTEGKHNSPLTAATENINRVINDNLLIPDFCADCWHPPEYSLS
jgi:hypothetical protein